MAAYETFCQIIGSIWLLNLAYRIVYALWNHKKE